MKVHAISSLFKFTMIGVGFALSIPLSSAQAAVHLGGWESVASTQVSHQCTGSDGSAIAADFEGDGRRDKAALLVNHLRNRLGVFVHVGPQTNVWQPVMVFPKGTAVQDICLQLVPPGSYKTACGLSHDKGHNVNCRLGEPENIDLTTNGIGVHLRGHETLFYWDKKTKRFSELAMNEESARGAQQ